MKIKKSAITIRAMDYNASPALIEEFGPHIERQKGDRFLTVCHEAKIEDRDLPALDILGWRPDLDRICITIKERKTEGKPKARSASWLFDVRPPGSDFSVFALISWDHASTGSTVWASVVGAPVDRYKKDLDLRTVNFSVTEGSALATSGIVREFSFTVHSGAPQMRRWCAKAIENFIASIL